jgi:hypothetical protein
MKIHGVFDLKIRGKVVAGRSPWTDNVWHKIGDVLICGDKKWRVIAVDTIFQGCFSIPTTRMHGLQLEPIDHNEQPNIGDDLVHGA